MELPLPSVFDNDDPSGISQPKLHDCHTSPSSFLLLGDSIVTPKKLPTVNASGPSSSHAHLAPPYFINFGISLHILNSSRIWHIPFAFQLVPTGIMALGLLTVPESPCWLASKGCSNEALKNLAYLRRRLPSFQDILHELAKIEAALAEERLFLGPCACSAMDVDWRTR
ncbi:hypothetical protein F5888DRAFT_1870121 [Russula emetica]|nr:hypothetical protein F5888DRAFT_1875803 [Russula emetica]KAF8488828.1 hypothetical protein F5888DRAFT_1809391 [Russula emetica]KAF8489646.1 hypothetical protein F5888DRAFT_1870118 [Russula emetica]KAF8489649.1 hypothetical protein F5888DRAFT_1870121 [Russula emetica]